MKRCVILLAIFVLFASCDSENTNQSLQKNETLSTAAMGRGSLEYSVVADSKMPKQESNEEQKIIRSAGLRYEVDDMTSALSDIKTLLENYRGEIQNERQYTHSDRLNTHLVLRIPAEHFETFITELLKGESIRRLEERSISARDVTEQFVDVQARLKTKKQAMARYRELLENAVTVSDIINVEDKIRRLQEEIESQEARLKYLSGQVEMSEIRIDIYEVTKTAYIPERSTGFLSTLLKALHSGLKGIILIFFWIVRLWPVWLIYIIIRSIHKSRKRNNE